MDSTNHCVQGTHQILIASLIRSIGYLTDHFCRQLQLSKASMQEMNLQGSQNGESMILIHVGALVH